MLPGIALATKHLKLMEDSAMKIEWKKSLSAVLLTSAALALSGCEVDVNEGPLEEAGEEVDDAMDGD